MLRRGLAIQQLAERIGSSEKSIRRWLDGVSVPHPRTRYQVAAAVGEVDGGMGQSGDLGDTEVDFVAGHCRPAR